MFGRFNLNITSSYSVIYTESTSKFDLILSLILLRRIFKLDIKDITLLKGNKHGVDIKNYVEENNIKHYLGFSDVYERIIHDIGSVDNDTAKYNIFTSVTDTNKKIRSMSVGLWATINDGLINNGKYDTNNDLTTVFIKTLILSSDKIVTSSIEKDKINSDNSNIFSLSLLTGLYNIILADKRELNLDSFKGFERSIIGAFEYLMDNLEDSAYESEEDNGE